MRKKGLAAFRSNIDTALDQILMLRILYPLFQEDKIMMKKGLAAFRSNDD